VPRRNPSFVAGEDVPKLFTASREAGIYPEVAVCLGLGLRRAELLGLTWGDIDVDASTVRVERGLQRIAGKLVRTIPKTATSRRVLHAPEFVIAALREVRTTLAARRLGTGLGRIPDDHLVLCGPNGEPLDPDNFSKRFSYMARAAGLDIHLHSLRHSAAVIGLQAGVDLKTISSTLGHASIRLTADTYSHVVASVKRDAADRVNAYIADRIAAAE
jgi:integrase